MRKSSLDTPLVDESTLDSWARHLGEAITDASDLRESLAAGSLPESFAASASQVPGSPALTAGGRTVTHGELDHLTGVATGSLARLGVRPGSRVMLVADVAVPEVVVYLAVLRLGATAVPVHPALTSAEIGEMASGSEVDLLVGSGVGLSTATSTVTDAVREVVGLRESDRETTELILSDRSGDPVPTRPIDPGSAAVLAFTSGTTGRAKPTPLSHSNLLASVRGVMLAWKWNRSDHLVHSLPISHQHGLSGVHATLLAGSRATLLGSLDPEATLATVQAGASIHFGVPTIHQRLLDGLGERAALLSGLRLAISGSGPLPTDLAERYGQSVGQNLLERYGTTESGLNVSNPYSGERVPGAVGIPLPGVEVAIVSPNGDLTEDGEAGEIMIRGPHVFAGYLGVADAEQPFLGGWFRTGDIGVVDPERGYLRVVGRSKEVIITGGMNVYPREVEDVIRRFPGVMDVAVVGVPSQAWGEEVVALVAPSDVDPESVSRLVADQLASYKRPKRVITVDDLPRTAVGKLRSEAISQMIPPGGS